MKQVFFIFILNILTIPGFSQARMVEITHYLFPGFLKGEVLMKSGVRNEAHLNYNSLTEEMIFVNDGKKLALDQLETIDTVYINGMKFIPFNNKFVQIIYDSKYALYAQHKCSLKEPGKPAGYGGTSQTSAITSYASIFAPGQVYELKLPDGFETISFIEYWLKKDGKLTKYISIKQLSMLFSDKEGLFKEYVKKYKVKYTNQASMVELIKYLEAK